MKKVLSFSLALLLTLAFAGVAGAGIQNSRHDLASADRPATYDANLGTLRTWGTCGPCHVPHGATGERLFPSVQAAAGGFFGPLCMSCHAAGVLDDVNTRVDGTVFGVNAHGLSKLPVFVASGDTAVETSGLPYVVTNAANGTDDIECLSCHDVHNQRNFRPFLQQDIDVLCSSCHPGRDNNDVLNVGFSNDVAGAGSTHPAGANFTGDVSGIALAPNSPFVTTWGTLLETNTGTDSVWTGNGPWDSGMHLTNYGAAGTEGVSCTACHAVHWDEDGTPIAKDNAYLGITNDTAATTGIANTFCEYCHQGASAVPATGYDPASTAVSFWNPGGTAHSHPCDNVGALSTTVTADMTWRPATTSQLDGNGISTLVCTSCHGVHRQDAAASETMTNTPILLNYSTATNTTDVCTACHDDGTFVAQHHPVGTATYATNGNNTAVGSLRCTGGNLIAGTCHGSNALGAAAHNRDAALGVMQGVAFRCVVCHTENPSTFTTTTPYTPSGTASHYVSLTGTWANTPPAYGYTISDVVTDYTGVNRSTDLAGGEIRTAGVAGLGNTWTGSALTSLFNDGATQQSLACESCHRLLPGNRTSTSAGATRLMVEDVGPTYEIGNGGAGAPPYDYAAAPYLCAGCHLIPGGTHPLSNADTTRSVNGIGVPHKNVPVGPYWPAATANTGFTATTNSLMNCESCHAAHDANTESGSYILDSSVDLGAGAATPMEIHPTIDYTLFCGACHGGFN